MMINYNDFDIQDQQEGDFQDNYSNQGSKLSSKYDLKKSPKEFDFEP